jgi:hypothetical protein
MAFLKDKTHRVDMGGLELIIDDIRKSDGSLVAAGGDSVTPQTAPAANAGVAAVAPTFTATSGSLPTPGGSTTFSDATTPTVVELLDAVCELRKAVADLVTENATFKTSINAHRTALLASGVYI